MKTSNIATLGLSFALLCGAGATYADTGSAAFDRAARGLATSAQTRHAWVNPIMPQASADAVMPHRGVSAGVQFMRSIAFYTRDMLDRGGWVNPYAPATGYDSGNALLAVRIGEGVTLTAPV